jgi:hypothetical protein
MPTPAQGPNTIVRICRETAAWGSTPTVPEWITVAVEPGGGFAPDLNQIESTLLGGDPNPRASLLGNGKGAGDFTFNPSLEVVAFLMGGAVGPIVTTGSADPYSHVSKLVSGSLYSYTIVETLDTGDSKSIVARGACMNACNLDVASEGPLKAKISFVAKAVTYEDATTILAAGTTVDMSAGVAIDHAWLSAGTLSIGGAVAYVKSGSVDISQNLKNDDFRAAGAGVLFGIARGRASVGATFECVWDSNSATKFAAVMSSPTTPIAVTLTWTNSTHSFSISLPETYGKPNLPKIPDGALSAQLSLKAAKNTSAGTSIATTTVNATAGTVYATA